MFRSATLKLTAWYLFVSMGISLIFSFVVYHIGSNEIARSVSQQSARIYQQFPVFDNNPILKDPDYINDSDHRLLLKLVFLNVFVLILAGLASYLLARRTLEPIEEAHQQQTRFTSDVSHELRTPLTAIKMESEVALMNPDATTKELMNTLSSNLEEVSKLEKLINNLLRLSRLEADELRENFGVISSKEVIEEAIKQVKPQAKSRKVEIDEKIIDKPFFGDQDSIIQLLVIMLDNAIKYSPSPSVVKVTSKVKEDKLVITLKDSGIGIEKDALEHIFDRFYRAESSRNKAGDSEGYGLGLSIAKMIADVHGAVITVSSQPNKGTEVQIELPIQA